MKETDTAFPYRHGPFFYYTRNEKGKPYRIHCRSKELRGEEQVVLDVNVEAEGSAHYDVADVSPSPGEHRLAAYAVDTTGYEVGCKGIPYGIWRRNSGGIPLVSTRFSPSMEMNRLTRDGAAEPVLRGQILRRERGQGNIYFPCPADHKHDWQPYPVDPYSCHMCDHTYIHKYMARYEVEYDKYGVGYKVKYDGKRVGIQGGIPDRI